MVSQATLDILQTPEPDRACRVGVRGELDAETSPRLVNSLRRTRASADRLRLDLSGVTFIDCTGLTALLTELQDARAEGYTLEVDRQLSRPVRRLVQMTRVDQLLWP